MTGSISGLIVSPLRIIADERGSVMHMMRCDDPCFAGFGEVYFSTVRPGVVKAWKRHREMTVSLAVPVGMIRLVIYDDRPNSSTHGRIEEHTLGTPDHYRLASISPGLWFGFQALGCTEALVANCASIPHRPEEGEGISPREARIPYHWPELELQ